MSNAHIDATARTVEFAYPAGYAKGGGASKAPRFEAIDIARGICILLVVLLHSNAHNIALVIGQGPIGHVWDTVASIAKPIRMPAFFLISGFLAHRTMKRPWADAVETRVFYIGYLYCLWLLANVLVTTSIGSLQGQPVDIGNIIEIYAARLIFPNSFLWFLYALVIYFVLTKLLQSFPAVLTVGGALLISAFSELLPEPLSYIMRCGVFYMIGAYFPQLVTQICDRASYRNVLLAGIGYAVFVGLVMIAGPKVPGVWLPSSFVGLILILMLAQLISGTALSKPLAYIGKRTLPIYVLHPLILIYLGWLIVNYGDGFVAFVRSGTVMMNLYPFVFIAVLVAVCLGFQSVAFALKQRWLFELPKALAFKPKPIPA